MTTPRRYSLPRTMEEAQERTFVAEDLATVARQDADALRAVLVTLEAATAALSRELSTARQDADDWAEEVQDLRATVAALQAELRAERAAMAAASPFTPADVFAAAGEVDGG